MKGTIKSQILSSLHDQFGNAPFTYTDIVKHVLLSRGNIAKLSDYNWKVHRGHYACAISCYNNNEYLYKCTKRNPWRLIKGMGTNGKTRYWVEHC